MRCSIYVWQKKTENKIDITNKQAVIRCSICNGEQVAGFKDLSTGKFEEIMLIKKTADLDKFMKMYKFESVAKEY